MNKLAFLVLVGMFILIVGVLAQEKSSDFSESNGFQWLFDEMNESDWDASTKELAISVLALRQGSFPVQKGVDKLLKTKSVNNWNGDVEDTAYATFALYMTGNDVSNEIEWLKQQATKGNDDAGWLLQIRSEINGFCELEYNEGIEKIITVVDNILTCDSVSGYKISLGSCIGVLDSYEPIIINCNNLPGAGTTLLYQGHTGYYLLEEVSIKGPISILNNIYSSYEATGIVNWILGEVGQLEEEHSSKHYIETNVNPGRDLDYGYAFQSTKDILYSNLLKERQNPSGSWSEDVFVTSYNYMLIKDSKAKTWLENEQSSDGSWNDDIFETGWALFVLSNRLAPSVPTICNNNGMCELGENSFNCPLDCSGNIITENCTNRIDDDSDLLIDCNDVLDCRSNLACANITTTVSEICNNLIDDDGDFLKDCDDPECNLNSYCAVSGAKCVSNLDCGVGEVCTGGFCFPEAVEVPISEEKEEGGNFWLWFFLILLILAVLATGFFAYRKYKGGGKKQESFDDFLKGQESISKPIVMQEPVMPVKNPYDSKEKDLDEAIRRAKEMLRKK